jgi:phosphoglycolate phosphatase
LHISFDFDYTLADSSQGTILCVNYALNALGLPIKSDAEIRKTIGLSLEETLRKLTSNVKPSAVAAFKSEFLKKADEVVVQNIQFYGATKLVLEDLKDDGHYLSIVSTKYTKRIVAALKRDGLEQYIDDIIGGDIVQEPKPSPEGLNLAICKSSISKQDTVYIGDSRSDGLAAESAGVSFVAVLTGETERAKLEIFKPLAVLDDLERLPTIVRETKFVAE